MTRKRKRFMPSKTKNKHRFFKSIPNLVREIVLGKTRNQISKLLSKVSLNMIKQVEIMLYHESKRCEICRTSSNQNDLMLCDRCDDAYHTKCLVSPLESIPEGSWLCPLCEGIVDQEEQVQKPGKDQKCGKCQQNIWSVMKLTRKAKRIKKMRRLKSPSKLEGNLQTQIVQQLKTYPEVLNKNGRAKMILKKIERVPEDISNSEGEDEVRSPIKVVEKQRQVKIHWVNKGAYCKYCQEWFHNSYCFSTRLNSSNCQSCQRKIRRNGPQSHQQFIQYVRKSYLEACQSFSVLGFDDVFPESKNFDLTTQRAHHIGLLVPPLLTNQQQIIRQQSTLYYALESEKMIFLDGQVYDHKNVSIESNNADSQLIMNPLSIQDEMAFIQFKSRSRWGFCSPVEIVEDRSLGFYARALRNIPENTILYQYAGEVICSRESLKQDNDSIMSLHRTSSSRQSFDLCPMKYGNGSKFISGINNSMRFSRQMENVRTLRFLFENKVRLLFYAKADIMKGETLYINYNGGAFHEYPTNDFIHKKK